MAVANLETPIPSDAADVADAVPTLPPGPSLDELYAAHRALGDVHSAMHERYMALCLAGQHICTPIGAAYSARIAAISAAFWLASAMLTELRAAERYHEQPFSTSDPAGGQVRDR